MAATTASGAAKKRETRPGMMAALSSEWSKFRALRSARIILVVALLLTVGITALVCIFGAGEGLAGAQEDGKYDVIFFSSFLGIWTFGSLGATFVATEYSTGIGSATLIATPRRWKVLAAKITIVVAVALVAGFLISFVNFFMIQVTLALIGEPTLSLFEGGMLRSVAVYIPVASAIFVIMSSSVAVIARGAASGVIVVLLLNILPVSVAPILGEGYAERIPRFVPGAASESLGGLSSPGSNGYLDTPMAALVLVAWMAVFLAVAFVAFGRRDS